MHQDSRSETSSEEESHGGKHLEDKGWTLNKAEKERVRRRKGAVADGRRGSKINTNSSKGAHGKTAEVPSQPGVGRTWVSLSITTSGA
jgi:hypothetical protein